MSSYQALSDRAVEIATVCKALDGSFCLRVFAAVAEEPRRTASALAVATGATPLIISDRLDLLKHAGLIDGERAIDGRVLYSPTPAGLAVAEALRGLANQWEEHHRCPPPTPSGRAAPSPA